MKQQQQQDGGFLCDRGTPPTTIVPARWVITVWKSDAIRGTALAFPRKSKSSVRKCAPKASARRLPLRFRAGHTKCLVPAYEWHRHRSDTVRSPIHYGVFPTFSDQKPPRMIPASDAKSVRSINQNLPSIRGTKP